EGAGREGQAGRRPQAGQGGGGGPRAVRAQGRRRGVPGRPGQEVPAQAGGEEGREEAGGEEVIRLVPALDAGTGRRNDQPGARATGDAPSVARAPGWWKVR